MATLRDLTKATAVPRRGKAPRRAPVQATHTVSIPVSVLRASNGLGVNVPELGDTFHSTHPFVMAIPLGQRVTATLTIEVNDNAR